MSESLIIAVVGFIGVVFGGVIVFLSTFVLELLKENRNSKRLAFAFKGEIQALATIAEKRHYVDYIKQDIEQMEQSGQPIPPVSVHVSREYFNIFKSNVSNIGTLKEPLPEWIARYYIQANSILEDLEIFRDGTLSDQNVNNLIRIEKELVSLMEDTFSLGDSIVKKIDELYS